MLKELLLAFLLPPLLSAQTMSFDLAPTATVSPSATFTQVSTSEEFMPVSATQILEESISDTMTATSLPSVNPTPTTTAIGSSQIYMNTVPTPFPSESLESTPFPMTTASPSDDAVSTDIIDSIELTVSSTTGDLVSSPVQSIAPTMNSLPPPTGLTQETEVGDS